MRRKGLGSGLAWLMEHISHDGDACLLWPLKSTKNGYPAVVINGVIEYAHRKMCLLVHGEPPPDKPHAAHRCGNALCVNPNHLRWASPAENSHDRREHKTDAAGSRNPGAKLTEDAVVAIREAHGSYTRASLAGAFGVSLQTIDSVLRGRSWSHVPFPANDNQRMNIAA